MRSGAIIAILVLAGCATPNEKTGTGPEEWIIHQADWMGPANHTANPKGGPDAYTTYVVNATPEGFVGLINLDYDYYGYGWDVQLKASVGGEDRQKISDLGFMAIDTGTDELDVLAAKFIRKYATTSDFDSINTTPAWYGGPGFSAYGDLNADFAANPRPFSVLVMAKSSEPISLRVMVKIGDLMYDAGGVPKHLIAAANGELEYGEWDAVGSGYDLATATAWLSPTSQCQLPELEYFHVYGSAKFSRSIGDCTISSEYELDLNAVGWTAAWADARIGTGSRTIVWDAMVSWELTSSSVVAPYGGPLPPAAIQLHHGHEDRRGNIVFISDVSEGPVKWRLSITENSTSAGGIHELSIISVAAPVEDWIGKPVRMCKTIGTDVTESVQSKRAESTGYCAGIYEVPSI